MGREHIYIGSEKGRSWRLSPVGDGSIVSSMEMKKLEVIIELRLYRHAVVGGTSAF